jgi:hypothetical protein
VNERTSPPTPLRKRRGEFFGQLRSFSLFWDNFSASPNIVQSAAIKCDGTTVCLINSPLRLRRGGRGEVFLKTLLTILIFFISIHPTHAAPPLYDVFINSQMSGTRSGVFFVDARTGLSTVALTNGYSHAILGNGVIYRDKATGNVGLATPDGTITQHPFIVANDYLTWITSPNREWIIWIEGKLQAGSLITNLYIARADGANRLIALKISSSKLLTVRPVAVSDDGSTILYARETEDPKAYRVYPAYTDVYRLTVATGTSERIPGEPRCACAAGFTADGRVIFRIEGNAQGYTAHFIEPSRPSDVLVAPVASRFNQSGDVLLSAGGDLAIYVLARGTANREAYTIVVADAIGKTQRILADGLQNRLRPVGIDKDALILSGWEKDGTYKIPLAGGALTQISAYSYLGAISG